MARQDAVNLGWKLAQVVKGISPDRLFDTYHAERHPVPINFGERGAFDGIAAPWMGRVRMIEAECLGVGAAGVSSLHRPPCWSVPTDTSHGWTKDQMRDSPMH